MKRTNWKSGKIKKKPNIRKAFEHIQTRRDPLYIKVVSKQSGTHWEEKFEEGGILDGNV